MSEKDLIFASLIRTDFPAGNQDFRAFLDRSARTVLGKDAAEAAAFADQHLVKYWNWFAALVDDQKRRGITPHLALDSTNRYFWNQHLSDSTSTDPKVSQPAILGLARAKMLLGIDAISDREFEALACVACNAIGSANVHLTPPGNEGGIDFLASITLRAPCHIFSAVGREFRIVGQSKKFGSKVPVDRVELLLRTMENVRSRSPRVANHIPSWFDTASGPIIGWIIGHSGFQSGGLDEARQHGLLVSDSLDMAELLALSSGFHGALAADQRADKIQPECQSIIAKFP